MVHPRPLYQESTPKQGGHPLHQADHPRQAARRKLYEVQRHRRQAMR